MECLVDGGHLRRTFLRRWLDWLDQRERALAALAREDQLTADLVERAKGDPVLRRAITRAALAVNP